MDDVDSEIWVDNPADKVRCLLIANDPPLPEMDANQVET
jgi:hypothetical protein